MSGKSIRSEDNGPDIFTFLVVELVYGINCKHGAFVVTGPRALDAVTRILGRYHSVLLGKRERKLKLGDLSCVKNVIAAGWSDCCQSVANCPGWVVSPRGLARQSGGEQVCETMNLRCGDAER